MAEEVDCIENMDSFSVRVSDAANPGDLRELTETEESSETTQTVSTAVPTEEPEKTEKLVRLPVSRVKNIIKTDPDVHLASQEAVFVVCKATELFVESLAKESYKHTAVSKRKTLQRKDIDSAIDSIDCLAFLDGALDV